jgi:hypothetical protein
MILCFSNDDLEVVNKAYGQQTRICGTAYCYLKDHSYSAYLKQDENLFITAHGNEDEIGNHGAGFDFTPQQLAAVLTKNVFPGKYTGSIYVSACDSSPKYVKGLLGQLGEDFTNRIYGAVGKIELAIQPPNNNMWILAK